MNSVGGGLGVPTWQWLICSGVNDQHKSLVTRPLQFHQQFEAIKQILNITGSKWREGGGLKPAQKFFQFSLCIYACTHTNSHTYIKYGWASHPHLLKKNLWLCSARSISLTLACFQRGPFCKFASTKSDLEYLLILLRKACYCFPLLMNNELKFNNGIENM